MADKRSQQPKAERKAKGLQKPKLLMLLIVLKDVVASTGSDLLARSVKIAVTNTKANLVRKLRPQKLKEREKAKRDTDLVRPVVRRPNLPRNLRVSSFSLVHALKAKIVPLPM